MNADHLMYAFSNLDLDLINSYDVLAVKKEKHKFSFKINKKAVQIVAAAACVTVIVFTAMLISDIVTRSRVDSTISEYANLSSFMEGNVDDKIFLDEISEFKNYAGSLGILSDFEHTGYEFQRYGYFTYELMDADEQSRFLFCDLFNYSDGTRLKIYTVPSDDMDFNRIGLIYYMKYGYSCETIESFEVNGVTCYVGTSLSTDKTTFMFVKDDIFYRGYIKKKQDIEMMHQWVEETLENNTF